MILRSIRGFLDPRHLLLWELVTHCSLRTFDFVTAAHSSCHGADMKSSSNTFSTVSFAEEKKDEKVGRREGDGKKRFVQLYTSKNYADRRADLVIPEKQHPEAIDEGHVDVNEPLSESELEKHKLSPQLVDAISKSAQVVWANTQREEGLLGRSDMRLQTAVGMPVAVDADGNMCVVVMFSPENLESTDEAMEYLRFLSSSATSSSIPCLFPVFDSNTMRPALMPHPHNDDSSQTVTNPPDPSLGKDITAHYCSMEDGGDGSSRDGSIVHRVSSMSRILLSCVFYVFKCSTGC